MYEERYREYPDFYEHVQELERQLNGQVGGYLAQFNPQTLSETQREEQAAHLRQLDIAFNEQVAQAHRAFGVPVLSDWLIALDATGVAIYHDGRSLARVRQRHATLTRETGRITLEVREIRFFPLDNDGTAKHLDGTLLNHDLLQARWEAREEAAAALSHATLRMLWAQMKAFFSLERTLTVLLGPQPGNVQALAGEQAQALRAELDHLATILPMALIFFQDLYERCTGYAAQIKEAQDWLRELDWHQKVCWDALLHPSNAEGDLGALMGNLRALLEALKPLEMLVIGGIAENDNNNH